MYDFKMNWKLFYDYIQGTKIPDETVSAYQNKVAKTGNFEVSHDDCVIFEKLDYLVFITKTIVTEV